MSSLTDSLQIDAAAWFAEEAGRVATSAAADALPTMVERSVEAGQMPPLLRRNEPEAYRIIEGDVTFFVDGEVIEAEEGDIVVAPAGSERTFRVESDGARWTVLTRVASLERYLDFAQAVAEPLEPKQPAWPSLSELAAVASVAEANGIELLGPPGALPVS
jgi:mannose-6-phosphate isomerase-like protein (cupin superfamily)